MRNLSTTSSSVTYRPTTEPSATDPGGESPLNRNVCFPHLFHMFCPCCQRCVDSRRNSYTLSITPALAMSSSFQPHHARQISEFVRNCVACSCAAKGRRAPTGYNVLQWIAPHTNVGMRPRTAIVGDIVASAQHPDRSDVATMTNQIFGILCYRYHDTAVFWRKCTNTLSNSMSIATWLPYERPWRMCMRRSFKILLSCSRPVMGYERPRNHGEIPL